MRFDTVIIGGGLSGLTCGISLQKRGVRCVIVSAGQSALHFSSGSFDLLGRLPDGTLVENPVEGATRLPASHPYSKIGADFEKYARAAKSQLLDCGIAVDGTEDKNEYHFTPMGTLKPSWLTLCDFNRFGNTDDFSGKKVKILNFSGFLDFNTKFIADSLEDSGAICSIENIRLPELDRLRVSPTEMRSTNIAKVLDDEAVFNRLLPILKDYSIGVDMVVLPAVFGLSSSKLVKVLKEAIPSTILMPTMPPSVAGIRTQQTLRSQFERHGGVFMLGDNIVKADLDGNRVKAVYSVNHGDIGFYADNFILATGSFFSNGLVASPSGIAEPVFGLEVDYDRDRALWYDPKFFNKQNYMSYGVSTDGDFRVKKGGTVMENLYAAGAILSGFNPIYEGCGAGVAMLTALKVADNLK